LRAASSELQVPMRRSRVISTRLLACRSSRLRLRPWHEYVRKPQGGACPERYRHP
jgi:hypothetical protein